MKWQPIETAPKDGTEVLVYEPPSKYTNGGIFLVEWHGCRSHYSGSKVKYGWSLPESHQDEQGGCATVDHPTHWMELPKPPGGKQ